MLSVDSLKEISSGCNYLKVAKLKKIIQDKMKNI